MRAADAAVRFGLSARQVQEMAAEGGIPGFKLPGCAAWLFDPQDLDNIIRAAKENSPCRNAASRKAKTQTTTSSSAAKPGGANTSSKASASVSPYELLMSRRRGRKGTGS
jgi:hypothetical protein